jgi:hypothetical protein
MSVLRRGTVRFCLTLLFAAGMACATTQPAGDQERMGDIPGLAPIPMETAKPRSAPVIVSASAGAGTVTSATSEQPAPTNAQPQATAPISQASCTALLGGRRLKRSALTRTLDAGLGSWLRGVDIEPQVDRGRFQGWMVRTIYPGDPCWATVDLRSGDVISRINHRSVERPEEAQAVWTTLNNAGEIVVEFVRAGQQRTLRFPVIDDAADVSPRR